MPDGNVLCLSPFGPVVVELVQTYLDTAHADVHSLESMASEVPVHELFSECGRVVVVLPEVRGLELLAFRSEPDVAHCRSHADVEVDLDLVVGVRVKRLRKL